MKIKGIETKRLKLRNYEKTDMQFVMSIWNDPEMGKYLPDPVIDQIDEKYRHALETLDEDERCCYLISESKETGERIGTCSFIPNEDGSVYDFAYCVHMKFGGQGYATEMLKGMMYYAKTQGAKHAIVFVNKENVASNLVVQKFKNSIIGESKYKKVGTNLTFEDYKYCLEI